jgi:inositol phosphorylceramide mannosyltransferase catalytic subunit
MNKKINYFLCILSYSFINYARDTNFVPVFFEASMRTSYMHDQQFAHQDPQWSFIRNLYHKHLIDQPKRSVHARIPKTIHQIWLGSPYPEKYLKLKNSWLKKHPEWQFKIWTDADVQSFGLKNINLFNKATNWGQKSDIWRLEILERHGGLYIDTDFYCLKSFDDLHHMCDFYIGLAHSKTVVFYNGLIGAAPEHPIIKHAIKNLQLASSLSDEQAIQKSTGPHFITKCFFEIAPTLSTINIAFPITFFYPFPNSHRIYSNNSTIVRSFIQPESYCVHLWEYSWSKDKK